MAFIGVALILILPSCATWKCFCNNEEVTERLLVVSGGGGPAAAAAL